MRELHVGQCGLSDQITISGGETIYDVLHVVTNRQKRAYAVHTLCGEVLQLEGKVPTVVYVGHNLALYNESTECPTCGLMCEG